MPWRACSRLLSFVTALSVLALAANARAGAAGKRPAPQPPTPQLTLTRLWDGRKIELGALDPRLHQVAVRGSLAVAPTRGQLLVIDAAAGEVVRTLDIPGARTAA